MRSPVVAARQQSAHARPQLVIGERLGEHVVAAAVEEPQPRQLVALTGEDDQRRVGIDPRRHAVAAADRVQQRERLTVDVADHEVRALVFERPQRVGAVLGDQDLVAVGGEVVGKKVRITGSSSATRIKRLACIGFSSFTGPRYARRPAVGWGNRQNGARVAAAACATTASALAGARAVSATAAAGVHAGACSAAAASCASPGSSAVACAAQPCRRRAAACASASSALSQIVVRVSCAPGSPGTHRAARAAPRAADRGRRRAAG